MLTLYLVAACAAASATDAPRVDSEPSRTPAPAKVQWRGTVEASAVAPALSGSVGAAPGGDGASQ